MSKTLLKTWQEIIISAIPPLTITGRNMNGNDRLNVNTNEETQKYKE